MENYNFLLLAHNKNTDKVKKVLSKILAYSLSDIKIITVLEPRNEFNTNAEYIILDLEKVIRNNSFKAILLDNNLYLGDKHPNEDFRLATKFIKESTSEIPVFIIKDNSLELVTYHHDNDNRHNQVPDYITTKPYEDGQINN